MPFCTGRSSWASIFQSRLRASQARIVSTRGSMRSPLHLFFIPPRMGMARVRGGPPRSMR
eukprot:1919652-Pyramimonas_sp.AAC.1